MHAQQCLLLKALDVNDGNNACCSRSILLLDGVQRVGTHACCIIAAAMSLQMLEVILEVTFRVVHPMPSVGNLDEVSIHIASCAIQRRPEVLPAVDGARHKVIRDCPRHCLQADCRTATRSRNPGPYTQMGTRVHHQPLRFTITAAAPWNKAFDGTFENLLTGETVWSIFHCSTIPVGPGSSCAMPYRIRRGKPPAAKVAVNPNESDIVCES
mmetsp:Transcript_51237/g.133036  ORF Transcript_51237/g.133036 Transcript_51237/m.133036 type:complete len:212 (-) Transcript_51237:68-703(-)